VNLQSLPQTIGLEHQDRVNRFNRLAQLNGITPPQVTQLQLAPGQVPGFNYPIPVVRVVFDERVFFDFNKDTVRPEAQKVLDIMAQNMKRDVPDANLLVLGHTDAIGSDAYNIDLSKRRAQSVLAGLIRRGVDPVQLGSVAIGKNQPIAPNSTDEGRARNRRVEFMISASQPANLQLVQQRRIIQEYLAVRPADVPETQTPRHVSVMTPRDFGLDRASVRPVDGQTARSTADAAQASIVQTAQAPAQIELQRPIPLKEVEVNRPKNVEAASLNEEFQM
jgi:outer membrane protein OmpA-like peptidoglycan-associated protein